MDVFDFLMNGLFPTQTETSNSIGKYGEDLTELMLNVSRLLGMHGVTIRNLYIPTSNGSTEIDLLFITFKGIFVLESKNYSGWIFGDDIQQQWTASLSNGQKNHFYNPVLQNRGHIKWLKKFLNEDIPMFSLIVFSDRCELKRISVTDPNVQVIKRCHMQFAIMNIWKCYPDVLSMDQVQNVVKKLNTCTFVDNRVKEEHIQQVKKNEMNCPICGSQLVLRTAKSGINAGKQFYGCSNFPRCRFTKNL